MKDRIGNTLAAGDKVLVELPTSSIVGFVATVEECGMIALRRGQEAAATPGRVVIALSIALPVDPAFDAVAQVVKVYDADKAHRAFSEPQGTSESPKAN